MGLGWWRIRVCRVFLGFCSVDFGDGALCGP